MGRARRPSNKRQQGTQSGLPGWAMLTIGLIIGLFVAFLVYLEDLEEPPATAVERDSGGDSAQSGEAGADAGAREDSSAEDEPRFEFYSILPELEVVVPEDERPGQPPSGDPGTDEESAGDDDAAGEPAASEEGTFYLQAGSFQEAQQADSMKARIALLGLDVAIQDVRLDGEQWHRVRVGPYSDPQALRDAQKRLRSNEIDYLVLRQRSSD